MVYERIRYLDIPADGGSIVSQADGDLPATYSTHVVDGRITKVWYDNSDVTATGTVWLLVSGTNEQIWKALEGAAADIIDYPRIQITDKDSTLVPAGSGNIWTEAVCRDSLLYVAGSAMGATKTINKIRVYYY